MHAAVFGCLGAAAVGRGAVSGLRSEALQPCLASPRSSHSDVADLLKWSLGHLQIPESQGLWLPIIRKGESSALRRRPANRPEIFTAALPTFFCLSSIMKVLVAALLVLCAMTLYAQEEKSHTPATCCFSYTSRLIPRKVVVHYYETSGLCTQRAIIFVTRKGRHVCSNPRDAWVQQYVKDLQMNP